MKVDRNDLWKASAETYDLLISDCGFVITDDTWHQNPLPTPSSRLYYVMDGSGVLLLDDKKIILEPGYVYLAPCGAACGYYGTESVTKLYFHVNIILSDGYDLFASCRQPARLERSRAYMAQMKDWYFSENTSDHIMLKGELWSAVSAFAELLLPDADRPASYSPPVAGAIEYIRTHLSAGLTVKAVSEAVFCSQAALAAAFRREIGSTVARYIEDLLMFEARRLLLSSGRTIGEISASLGYCDQFYFSRRFRNRFAMSPKAFRNQRAET